MKMPMMMNMKPRRNSSKAPAAHLDEDTLSSFTYPILLPHSNTSLLLLAGNQLLLTDSHIFVSAALQHWVTG
jgi:hypothetical protein